MWCSNSVKGIGHTRIPSLNSTSCPFISVRRKARASDLSVKSCRPPDIFSTENLDEVFSVQAGDEFNGYPKEQGYRRHDPHFSFRDVFSPNHTLPSKTVLFKQPIWRASEHLPCVSKWSQSSYQISSNSSSGTSSKNRQKGVPPAKTTVRLERVIAT